MTPTEDGELVVTLEAGNPFHFLAARGECGGTAPNLDCDAHAASAMPDQLSLPVTAGTVYYIRVDSYQSAAGSLTLTLALN